MSLAQDAVEGMCCSWCFVYFERPHGYPVLCKSCAENAPPDMRDPIPTATEKEL